MQEKISFRTRENITYVLIWTFVFLSPIFFEWFMSVSENNITFQWDRVLRWWTEILPFLLFFCLHNWLLAPLITHRHKHFYYLSGSLVLLGIFTLYQCQTRPPTPQDLQEETRPEKMYDGSDPPPERPPLQREEKFQWQEVEDHRPPLIIGQHDVMAVTVLFLLFAANLGVKYYFRHRAHELQLMELERKNLEDRLAYLRYQMNPHFLMNTLNNIHSLIDIEPERAQTAIVEFSRLLRYTLYDAEHEFVPLQKEAAFIHNYLELMRIRFSDEVDIQYNVPSPLPSGNVPPLIYACFVENAFKYGVSYQHHSFVHISFAEEAGRLQFNCINSVFPKSETNAISGGLGLRNVRQRLDIMFPDNHEFIIQETGKTYAVYLEIPINNELNINQLNNNQSKS